MRAPAVHVLAVVLLAVAVLAAPTAGAQTREQPVLVKALTPLDAAVDADAAPEFRFSLRNTNTRTPFFVSVTHDGLTGWTVAPDADEFYLPPETVTNVTLTLRAEGDAPEHAEGTVAFTFVNSDTGTVTETSKAVTVRAERPPLVLGAFENPLPPPLDDAYGVFLLNVGFWAVVGLGAFFTGDTVARYLTRFARAEVTRVVIQKVRAPLFWFVLLLGFKQSIDVLPSNPITDFTQRFIAAVAVGALGVYVAYRIIDAALYYYAAEISPRTASRVDDILVPAARKIAVVVLFIIGVGLVLRAFGLDPTVLFGAAGIAGLVIAFAAQETISNLFSGLFIMLDRPFAEGEDIQLETGEVCRVERIGLRSTRLYHYRNHELIILPNNQLASRRVVNLTAPDPRYKMNLEFGVSYKTDVDHLRETCLRVCRGTPGVDVGDDPIVLFAGFGDSALNFILRYTVLDYRDRFAVTSEMRGRLLKTFRAEGIDIPFPQRVLHAAPTEGGARSLRIETTGERPNP